MKCQLWTIVLQSQLASLGIQSPCQMMIGVSNHLLSKVFRFHYHSQKVIGSLGPCARPEISWSASSARGASVLGCSLDVAWALKAAAKDAASYPVEGRPQSYKAPSLRS